MELTILIIFILVIISKLLDKKTSFKKNKITLPYYAKNSLMTKSEIYFYETLQKAIDKNSMTIMSKVRLWDIIGVSKGTSNRLIYENKIRAKHFDFIICDNQTLRPLLVIELDDKSHGRQDRKVSDEFKNQVLEKVGIPIIRIKVSAQYNKDAIEKLIKETLVS